MRCSNIDELIGLVDRAGIASLLHRRGHIQLTIKKEENGDYIFGDAEQEIICSRETIVWLLNKMNFEIRNMEIRI